MKTKLFFFLVSVASIMHGQTRQPHWTPRVVENHFNGIPKTVLYYEKEGNKICYHQQVLFYPSSALWEECDLASSGAKEGRWVKYWPTGERAAEGTYHEDRLEGEVIGYFPDQKIQSKELYKQFLRGFFHKLWDNSIL